MIAFLPVVRLKELSGVTAKKNFSAATKKMSSVERMISSIFYRFSSDITCPAMFVRHPKAGDEPVIGVVYEIDVSKEDLISLAENMFEEATKYNYGCKDISIINTPLVTVFIKNDFLDGDWSKYGYEYSGKDGISIPS